jgi:triphosphoribosyl-dephospho-CoA synthase
MASKPGNVHRGADFEDLTFADLATSAVAIGPAFDELAGGRAGRLVLAAVEATRALVSTNTNLGMLLLMAPLAAVPRDEALSAGIAAVLDRLDADDARQVYEAIRLAKPGGLGRVEKHDLSGPPPGDLLVAMRAAADRDLVARQYANGFAEVLGVTLPLLGAGQQRGWSLNDTIIHAHLTVMSQYPDSLIARKCGAAVAEEAAAYAAQVLRSGAPGEEAYHEALADLDFWLRGDGHRRNPGTTADLIAAGLFAALREGIIELPVRFY